MKANTADRLSNDVSPKGKVRYSVFAVVVIGALILSVALISSKDNTNELENSDGSSSSLDAPARSIASKDQSTDIPRTALQQDSLFPMFSPTAEPPLTMETSDQELRVAIGKAGTNNLLSSALRDDHLLQRGVALIDNASRGALLRRILGIPSPKEKFLSVTNDGKQFMDPAGFQRFDAYAEAIAELDTKALVATFHRFRPLLEKSFTELGLSPDDFDNAVIQALDFVIATPELTKPIEIRQERLIYHYVDTDLERLPYVQKMLVRMGLENTILIKTQAKALRAGLLQGDGHD